MSRVVSDWGNWTFPFDDSKSHAILSITLSHFNKGFLVFDEGEFGADPERACHEMESLMGNLDAYPNRSSGDKSKMVQAHDVIFEQLCKVYVF